MPEHAEKSQSPDSLARPKRPEHLVSKTLPEIPSVTGMSADDASVTYSHYRTGLSHHRTNLSGHRTDLSEYRTDLSTYRTELSDHRTELSMRRSGMALQRTRMAADRTLMAVIRTSLSLIGFGFTIYQVFQKLYEAGTISQASAPRNLGLALIVAGIVLMGGGVWRHIQFATELRHSRSEMIEGQMIHGKSRYPVSITLIVSFGLMAIGLAAIINILMD